MAMRIFYGGGLAGALRRPKVTLGTFDGVHRGHQRVLGDLLTWCRTEDCDAAVVTFDSKPHRVLSGKPFNQITTLPHRLVLFERLGMDAAVVMEFDQALAAVEPEAFVEEYLVEGLQISGVQLGHDTRFGRGGRGDAALMTQLGRQYGFEVRTSQVELLDGAPVSSTRVRKAITTGDLRAAEQMLARPVSLFGAVVRGTARGRTIGYPTANVDPHHEVLPPEGVYATRTFVDARAFDSVTNIGRPPTLAATGPRFQSNKTVVECHLMEFAGDLYGKDVEIQFAEFIRSERRFESPQALALAIRNDVEAARHILAGR